MQVWSCEGKKEEMLNRKWVRLWCNSKCLGQEQVTDKKSPLGRPRSPRDRPSPVSLLHLVIGWKQARSLMATTAPTQVRRAAHHGSQRSLFQRMWGEVQPPLLELILGHNKYPSSPFSTLNSLHPWLSPHLKSGGVTRTVILRGSESLLFIPFQAWTAECIKYDGARRDV